MGAFKAANPDHLLSQSRSAQQTSAICTSHTDERHVEASGLSGPPGSFLSTTSAAYLAAKKYIFVKGMCGMMLNMTICLISTTHTEDCRRNRKECHRVGKTGKWTPACLPDRGARTWAVPSFRARPRPLHAGCHERTSERNSTSGVAGERNSERRVGSAWGGGGRASRLHGAHGEGSLTSLLLICVLRTQHCAASWPPSPPPSSGRGLRRGAAVTA